MTATILYLFNRFANASDGQEEAYELSISTTNRSPEDCYKRKNLEFLLQKACQGDTIYSVLNFPFHIHWHD